jgi:hypothetical protein
MPTDILSIVLLPDSMKPEALEYLNKTISQQTIEGVFSFVKKQSQLFNEHAHHLAEVLRVIDNAPPGINLNQFQDGFIEWLRRNGVSSSRITQLRGFLRLRTRALGPDSRYTASEQEVIKTLEVEKAYLFGRLTFEGQAKALEIYKEDGRLSQRDLRELIKDYKYDPSEKWKEKHEGKSMPSHEKRFDPSKPPDQLSEDLACKLQEVISRFMSLMPKWQEDRRVINLIDYNQLTTLQAAVGAFMDPYGIEDDDLPF